MNHLSSLDQIVEQSVSQLANETDEVHKSGFFREYLDVIAKFWRYSYRNQLLIHVQRRDASRIAGFRKWNELGRKVLKGSKAIKILAPFTKKIKEKDSIGEEKEVSRTYFFPVNVFDVSQTIGKPLPEISLEVEGNNQQQLLNKLLEYCALQNIKTEFKELGINGLYGYSSGGKIAVDSKQSINTQVNTLIHEIAHELTHYSKEGKKFSRQEKEIQAEATNYVITKALGLQNKSSTYLALYIKDKDKILENLSVISKTAKEILLHLDCQEQQNFFNAQVSNTETIIFPNQKTTKEAI